MRNNISRVDTIETLSKHLINLYSSISSILDKREHITDIDNLYVCREYIKNIQVDISQRKSCFKIYREFIDHQDGFFRNDRPLLFKDRSFAIKEQKLSDEKSNSPTYSDIRHQVLVALLVLNTRIYEKCVNLCYSLHKPPKVNSNVYASELLFIKKGFNKYTNTKYQSLMEELKSKFGYSLGVILYFRNQLVHIGELYDKDKNLFVSSDDQGKDYLKPKFIEESHNKILQHYKLPQFSQGHFDLLSNLDTKLGTIINRCMLISDHHIGFFMHSVFSINHMQN